MRELYQFFTNCHNQNEFVMLITILLGLKKTVKITVYYNALDNLFMYNACIYKGNINYIDFTL